MSKLKMNPLFKKLMLLVLVVGPAYWLMLTDDGQRRVDTVLLGLFGEPAIEFNLKVLDQGFSESEVLAVYPEREWQCAEARSDLGERRCLTGISAFNGLPARYLSLFFRAGVMSALKLSYHPAYHEQLAGQLRRQFGQPMQLASAAAARPTPGSLYRWPLQLGSIVMKARLEAGDEAAMMWLSGAASIVKGVAPESK